MQIGQFVNMLNFKQSSTLPSDTKRNPIKHVKVVIIKSGKELNDPMTKMKNNEEKKVVEEEQKVEVQKLKEDEVIPGRISFLDNPPLYVLPIPYL